MLRTARIIANKIIQVAPSPARAASISFVKNMKTN